MSNAKYFILCVLLVSVLHLPSTYSTDCFACAQEVMTCIDNCANVHGTIIGEILGRKRRAASCYDLCVQTSKIARVFLDQLVTLHQNKYYYKHKYCNLHRL